MRGVKTLIEAVPECQFNFGLTHYNDSQGRNPPCYEMDRQGFSMLVTGFTGTDAKKFTYQYTTAFERMINERKQSLLPVSKITENQNMIAENLYSFGMSQRDFNIEQQKVNLNHDERIRALEERRANEIVVDNCFVFPLAKRSQYEMHNFYSVTQIGAAFNLSGKALNRLLYDFGLQYPYQDGVAWLIARRYKEQGLSREITGKIVRASDRTPREQTIGWTEKSVQFICDLLKKKGYAQRMPVSNKIRARRPFKMKK
jgi:hypothetical protein